MKPAAPPELPRDVQRRLALQLGVARLLSPLTTFAVVGLLRLWLRLRVKNIREARRVYRELMAPGSGPLLICANHLTMIDSALIAWALAPPAWYVVHFAALPWNVPERRNFASTPLMKVLAYVYKCLPIVRGGAREEVAGTLARFSHLLSKGEVGLIFPEGGRSRSGRVDVDDAAWGVGRIVKNLPRCRVLCVYVRGEQQDSYSDVPTRGDRLYVSLSVLEPKSDHAGLRGSRDVARQIVTQLADMEREYFDGRQ